MATGIRSASLRRYGPAASLGRNDPSVELPCRSAFVGGHNSSPGSGQLFGIALSSGKDVEMPTHQSEGPLRPGDRAPNVVLDAVTRDGKVAIDDFRGHKPVLVGLYRGLHCPFCRRHIAALAQLDPALHEMGVESLAVVNTPTERARLYFRYHPIPTLLAASDPE